MVAVARRAWLNSALVIILATVASRGLGLLREVVLASQFGTGLGDYSESAAYRAAFQVPDILYTLIIGGALGSSLIPVFSRFLGQNEPAKAWRLANAVVNYSVLVLVVAALVAWPLMPFIVSNLLAPHFSPAMQTLTTDLARLLLLQPLFIGLGGVALALLNGSEQFLWPALAPLIYNTSIILGALFLAEPFKIFGVVYGVLFGAVGYLLVQLPPLFRQGFYWRPSLALWQVEGAPSVLKNLGPRLLGQAVFQFNFFVATNLGSGLNSGAARVSAFNYAYQLFMLPHGVFALSLATVALPAMSRQLGANDLPAMKRTLGGSLRQVLFFVLPAAVGLLLLNRPIVGTVYQGGKFTEQSTSLVSETLLFFSFGLVSYGLVEILTRAFYALQDTRTPVIVAVVTVAINFGLSLALVGPLAQGGLALALALSTTCEMIGLAILLWRRIGSFEIVSRATLKIGAATIAMGLALWIAELLLQKPLDSAGKLLTILFTLALIGWGGLVYAGVAYLLKIEELRGAINRFLRRR